MMYILFFSPEKGILLGYIYQRYAKVQNQTEISKTVFVFIFFLQFTSCVLHYSLKCIVHLCYCSIKIFEVFLLHHNTIMVYVYGLRLRLVVHYISVRALHIRCLFRNSNAHMFFSGSRSS